jgi:hypothetical protein
MIKKREKDSNKYKDINKREEDKKIVKKRNVWDKKGRDVSHE